MFMDMHRITPFILVDTYAITGHKYCKMRNNECILNCSVVYVMMFLMK